MKTLIRGTKSNMVESRSVFLLREWIGLLLLEGKFEDAVARYPQYEAELLKVKNEGLHPKFYEWVVKQLKKGEEILRIIDTVKRFEKNSQRLTKKDINAYSFIQELVDELEAIGTSTRSKKLEVKTRGAEKIVSEGPIDLYYIKNKDAAICYGAGTKWCITAKNATHWENYSDKNVLFYYAIDPQRKPTDPMHKVAFAIIRNQIDDTNVGVECYNALDKKITPQGVYASLLDVAKNHSNGRPSTFYRVKMRRGTFDKDDVAALISDFEKGLANLNQIGRISDFSFLEQIYAAGVRLEKSNKDIGEKMYSAAVFRMIDLEFPTQEIIAMVEKYN